MRSMTIRQLAERHAAHVSFVNFIGWRLRR